MQDGHRTAAIYCRISQDDTGEGAGVKRQQDDCRKLAKAKGWTVAEPPLIDNDKSAYNGRSRPEYEALLAGLRDGTYDAVIAWKLDRLTRRGVRGLVPLLDALDGRPVVCVHDSIDTSTAMGEGVAAMLASVARTESENIGKRVARFKEERASQGLPAGGKRAFGYEPDGITIRKVEARVYRKAARDVLAGKAFSAVAREWNAQGVKPPQKAKAWTTTTVRHVLTSPRHAGRRVHQGEDFGEAKWPGIIDRATHEALVARGGNGGTQPRRRSLLTRLVQCACGAGMNRDGRSFRCRTCGSTIKADTLERVVEEMVVELLTSRKLAKVMAHEDRGQAESDAALDLAAAEAKLAELAEMLGDGELDRAAYMRARKKPEKKRDEARARLARKDGTHALERFRDRQRPADLYKRLDTDERRAVISALLDRIVIHPAKSQGARFDVARVEPIWRA
jgi:site-specific DNA recombinase